MLHLCRVSADDWFTNIAVQWENNIKISGKADKIVTENPILHWIYRTSSNNIDIFMNVCAFIVLTFQWNKKKKNNWIVMEWITENKTKCAHRILKRSKTIIIQLTKYIYIYMPFIWSDRQYLYYIIVMSNIKYRKSIVEKTNIPYKKKNLEICSSNQQAEKERENVLSLPFGWL